MSEERMARMSLELAATKCEARLLESGDYWVTLTGVLAVNGQPAALGTPDERGEQCLLNRVQVELMHSPFLKDVATIRSDDEVTLTGVVAAREFVEASIVGGAAMRACLARISVPRGSAP